MICTGIGAASFIRVIMGNTHALFITQLHQSSSVYATLTLLITASYLLGILVTRQLPKTIAVSVIRLTCVMTLWVISMTTVIFAHLMSTLEFSACLCSASLCFGIINPISSSQGFTVIKFNRGAASALYTCAFATMSMVYSISSPFLGSKVSQTMSTALVLFSTILAIVTLWIRGKKT